jgi:hypothetical protein
MSSRNNLILDATRCRQMAESEADSRVRATLLALAQHLDKQRPDGTVPGTHHC